MVYTAEYLYGLLPAIYRIRDAEQGHQLRALISVIAEQAAVMEADIGRLYDNGFVETCDEWVVPYIGDLLGVRGLHPVTEATFSQRARVANTLGYRRRKGTASMLEQLARDTTGWPARVVECFQLLAVTQHVNHVRLQNVRTPDIRSVEALDLLDGPFDGIAHTADVRHVDRGRGIHNIMNVGIYFWRLRAYPISRSPAFPHGPGRFGFSQLGHDIPLFTQPATEPDPAHLAEEINVPAPIRRLALHASLASKDERYYGDGRSFRIWAGASEVPREQIVACNLTGWRHRPERGHVAVDPVLGRIAFPADREPDPAAVRVEYHYGASADLGGGCYERELTGQGFVQYRIAKAIPAMDSVQKAIDRWLSDGAPNAVLEIQDNEIYEESLRLTVRSGQAVIVRAANQRRPVIRLTDPFEIGGGRAGDRDHPGGRVTLDGLLIAGQHVEIRDGDFDLLELRHSTLVPGLALTPRGAPVSPGEPSIVAGGKNTMTVAVTRSICGGLRLPDAATLTVTDSLIDGTGGPAIRTGTLIADESTIIGAVSATLVERASNSIFTGGITAERTQVGCVRFCYLGQRSSVPRRYHCQPDAAIEKAIDAATEGRLRLEPVRRNAIRTEVRARVQPVFVDTRYGTPAYGQLDPRCPVEISAGADDQGEMGVFHHLQQPQRDSNFRASLDEYLRLGLEAGIIRVT